MSKLTNKIEANDRSVLEVLDKKKYTVDYFQREYSWGKKHIEQLVTDLTSSFLNEYRDGDSREQGEDYNTYYLGPFVLSEKDSKRSIIDGQQRLTSLTLFLIYLDNLQKSLQLEESLSDMIFSESRGKRSFNIQVDERMHCLEQLFNQGSYQPREDDDESTINMAERYDDIADAFPEELKSNALPHFLDWLKYNVVLVEIIAYSDDNAYTIFETMNDRGLNLTSTEMLKGYVLSRFSDYQRRQKANEHWKLAIQQLHGHDKEEDQRFFQTWLRSQYADTIRQGSAGSQNEDFEKIGTRFHSWVRDNLDKMGLSADSSDDFERFIGQDFKFFLSAYLKILSAEKTLTGGLEHVFYIQRWGIATSLSYPLLLAPLTLHDDESVVVQKLNLVARYIETFVVRRSVNFRKFASSSIRYTMYTLVKEIRGKDLESLRSLLQGKLDAMDETWSGMDNFRLHGQNKRFVKFLLARITAYIEQAAGYTTNFETYYHKPGGRPFEVEHIWANKFAHHRDEFDQESDFEDYRNRLGGLILLPRGTNQSYGAKPYEEKRDHYVKENNLLAQSLCDITYDNNPNFKNMCERLALNFKPHAQFNKQDLEERQQLYRAIAEQIWSTEL
ncbi:hypothetical protein CHH28_13350 [Bacterioplanes sanyensis]|uniref:DUF262 domain-containing protein n=1 Tax=Bacterioplanes sanyensis TaxID=1249553 RepID=A0A222FLX1_9GAMM|nr:DUF262 domain-containing protein [Bacterioplanes sanyensis]ASP39596.1 hypothetical protein CHH28_13350 [Bacterioplanes sanyensis]